MHKVKTFLAAWPLYAYLLPVFFVLHGWIEFFNPVLAKDALLLIFLYTAGTLLLTGLFWIFFKNFHKASLVVFFLMAYNFFFGSMHDTLKHYMGTSLLVKYSFILPFTLILFLVLVFYIKKAKRSFRTTTQYLNLLLLILFIVDLSTLLVQFSKPQKQGVEDLSASLKPCQPCPKPDIYLIVADEYPGEGTLKTVFSYDNSGFENELQKRKFHLVKGSASNYNHTYYSMASLLNMDYLKSLEQNFTNHRDMLTCTNLINHNNVVRFLKDNGYSIFNYSFFTVDGQAGAVTNPFYTSKASLITAQTFLHRVKKDLGYHFLSSPSTSVNSEVDSLTRSVATTSVTTPKFVYAHFNMPHHPYAFDKKGKEVPASLLTDNYKFNKEAFLDYLAYTNNKLLALVDHIRQTAKMPPVIILMSDHGFRQFPGNDSSYNKYYFINLNAVYFPNGDYSRFYEGMSNVNQFRVVFNSLFDQKLPLLKDSSSFLWEK